MDSTMIHYIGGVKGGETGLRYFRLTIFDFRLKTESERQNIFDWKHNYTATFIFRFSFENRNSKIENFSYLSVFPNHLYRFAAIH